MNNKKRILILLLIIITLIFTSCSGKDKNNAIETEIVEKSEEINKEEETELMPEDVAIDETILVEEPIFITSIGQSSDASVLNALVKRIEVEAGFDNLAEHQDIVEYKTLFITPGGSSKGMGAAGISTEDELERAEKLINTCKENGIKVVLFHLGGDSRRGELSDRFIDVVMQASDAIVVTKDGNKDNKFSDFSIEKNIPLVITESIAEVEKPLKKMLGK